MKYTLKTRDFLKGALMAILVPAVYIIQTSVDAGVLTFNWKQILIASISGLLAYLIKNFFTDDIKVAKNIIAKDRLDNQRP
jgi:hypothetical protein